LAKRSGRSDLTDVGQETEWTHGQKSGTHRRYHPLVAERWKEPSSVTLLYEPGCPGDRLT
ncbi:MAG: hypothetical protein ABWY52_02180, partial [Candidatus Limnocylindrales bacterium]